MAKRNNEVGGFERKPRDFYGTIDPSAVDIFVHIEGTVRYIEPCAGSGNLCNLLQDYPNFVLHKAFDIEPQADFIEKKDASLLTMEDLEGADVVITNPPYKWEMLKPIMDNLLPKIPAWLLLPADTMHNVRMAEYINLYCYGIASVGRLYWEENKVKGKDNFVWYYFLPKALEERKADFPQFLPRMKK